LFQIETETLTSKTNKSKLTRGHRSHSGGFIDNNKKRRFYKRCEVVVKKTCRRVIQKHRAYTQLTEQFSTSAGAGYEAFVASLERYFDKIFEAR
jgi:hypothetical protein